MNSDSDSELKEAQKALIKQKPLVKAYCGDEVKDKMIAGEAAVALVWSGDATYCMSENDELDYVIPVEGSNIFFDAWCIPASAKNVSGAEKFIDFMCRPDIQAKNALYIGYSSPSTPARELMGEDGQDPTAYPDITKYDLEFFSALDDETKEYYNKLWTDIRSSR